MPSGWQPVSLRFDPAGTELLCRHCDEWWPLTPVEWMRRGNGNIRIDLCRSCHNERNKLYQALRRHDPTFVETEKQRHKAYHRKYRAWLTRNHPELLGAYGREQRELDRLRHSDKRAA